MSGSLELDRAPVPAATVLVRGARLLDPRADLDGKADLLLRDGVVAEIGDDLEAPQGAELVDGEGLHAFPAFVDPHVHLRTPGREDEEDIDSGTRAAAAGGFCAILAQPNTHPVVDSAPVLRSLRERARAEARIPTGFLAAITAGQEGERLTEMAELAEAGAAGFTDDGLPVRSAGVMRQALQYQRLAGRLLALHEEDPSLSGQGAMHEGEVSALLGLAGIPSISESVQVARDCALAAYEDGRIHVQHVSALETVEVIERARAAGTQVTCEATPHHLLLTDQAVHALDTNFKMNPPLRTEADRQALIEALRSGTIDCIATDHAPHAREEKEQPFELAPMGVTGLETAFAALHTGLVLPGLVDLRLLVELLTAGGQPFGLPVPRIARGEPANVVLVDLDAEWEVGEAGYESRSANCAFAGRRVTGRVRVTVADGAVAYRERTFALGAVAYVPPARLLDRGRAALVVVDVQEAFRPAVLDFDRVAAGAATLVRGARILDLPVIVTQQYPKGLGATVPELAEHLDGIEPLDKVCFSAAAADGFDLQGRDQALICGIESHVCVSQTAHDLLDRGVQVHVARDAVTSRSEENRELGLHKMEGSGAIVTSVETALFELLGAAGTDEFKQVQALVK